MSSKKIMINTVSHVVTAIIFVWAKSQHCYHFIGQQLPYTSSSPKAETWTGRGTQIVIVTSTDLLSSNHKKLEIENERPAIGTSQKWLYHLVPCKGALPNYSSINSLTNCWCKSIMKHFCWWHENRNCSLCINNFDSRLESVWVMQI